MAPATVPPMTIRTNRRLDSRPKRLHNGGTTQLTADICLHASAFRATPLTAVDSQLFALGTCKTTRIFGPTFCSFQPSRCRRFRVRGRALVLQGSGAPQDFSELLIKMADRKAHCSTKRSCEDPETFNPVQACLSSVSKQLGFMNMLYHEPSLCEKFRDSRYQLDALLVMLKPDTNCRVILQYHVQERRLLGASPPIDSLLTHYVGKPCKAQVFASPMPPV